MMSFWKLRRGRGSFVPSANDRVAVIDLGRHPVADSTDMEYTVTPLDTLYRNYKDEKGTAQRVTLEVTLNGLVVYKLKGFSSPPTPQQADSADNRTIIPTSKTHFGATDPARPKVFFVVKTGEECPGATDATTYECHAFLCDTPSAAKGLTLQLLDIFSNNQENEWAMLAYRKTFDYASAGTQSRGDKVLLRTQSLNLPLSRGRLAAVSTIKVTMNSDNQDPSLREPNKNSDIARILAKREVEQAPTRPSSDGSLGGGDKISSTDASSGTGPSIHSEDNFDTVFGKNLGFAETANLSLVSESLSTSASTALRETQQLQTPQDQSRQPSSKQSSEDSPSSRKKAAKEADEDTKENQRAVPQEAEEPPMNAKRKSVRFSDSTETI